MRRDWYVLEWDMIMEGDMENLELEIGRYGRTEFGYVVYSRGSKNISTFGTTKE